MTNEQVNDCRRTSANYKNLLQNGKLVRVTGQSNYFVFGFMTLSFN